MEAFPIAPTPFAGAARRTHLTAGFDWLRLAWAIFTAAPSLWLILGIALLLVWGLFEFLFLFTLATLPAHPMRQILAAFFLLAPVFVLPFLTAGGLQVCRQLATEKTPQFSDLAWGVQNHLRPLSIVGLCYLAGWLGLYAIYAAIDGPLALFLPPLAGLAFLMAVWFAPVLVTFHGLSPIAAIRASFDACFQNFWAFAIFGLVMSILHVLALLPLGLGLIVLVPVGIACLHVSYRDVFPES